MAVGPEGPLSLPELNGVRRIPEDDCRCLCGSLLARVTERGVELKCRRCKRTLLVPLPPELRRGAAIEPVEIR